VNCLKHVMRLLGAFSLPLLAACTSGQSAIQPPVNNSINPIAQSTLQFAVGTADIAGAVGLDTLVTLRQTASPYIGTSILTNAPTIIGPTGFTVPAQPDAYGDVGSNKISGTLVTNIASAPPATTFNPSGGNAAIASSYGFLPATVTNSNTTPSLLPFPLPFYAGANARLTHGALTYIGGPPTFMPPGHTSTQDGTFPSGYAGFVLGFVDFQAAPVTGGYLLDVLIPTGISQSGQVSSETKSQTAKLASLTPLAAWLTPPTFAPDGAGGGVISTNFGAGAGITEEYVELVDVGVPSSSGGSNGGFACQKTGAGPYYYTFKVTPGQVAVTVPDDIGAAPPGEVQPHTFCTSAENGGASGDGWLVYGFATDYPLFNSAFPQSNGRAAPAIVGVNGQSDVTTSDASSGNVP